MLYYSVQAQSCAQPRSLPEAKTLVPGVDLAQLVDVNSLHQLGLGCSPHLSIDRVALVVKATDLVERTEESLLDVQVDVWLDALH